jgi:hypothetical protein
MTSRRERDHLQPPPRTLEEALERARRHGLAALAESASAARALVDAAALAATGAPSDANGRLAVATGWLDAAAEHARAGAGRPLGPWLDAVSDALDDEIERWEEKSRVDPEARAVLRAFLGVREILWEFGLRARDAAGASPTADDLRAPRTAPVETARARSPRTARRGAAGLQRVPVEG